MNPYFKARDRALRKARKHTKRAVEMHHMGIWLDQVNSMTEKMHKDAVLMNKKYLKILKKQKKMEMEINKMLDEISGRILGD